MNPTLRSPRFVAALAVVAALAAVAGVPSAATRTSVVPFIEDDLPRALAEAKQRDLPIFVESWAPW
jgi:hypothetical protein